MDASSFYTDKYDEELMISVKTSEECNGPANLEYIIKCIWLWSVPFSFEH